jgi:hypothetical protein
LHLDFETRFDQEKFEILFEKKYSQLIVDKLKTVQEHQKLVELLPDGSQSPEVSKTKNLLRLFADTIGSPEFSASETVSASIVAKMAAFDATPDGFRFKASRQSGLDLLDEKCLLSLHKFYAELGNKNEPIRALLDWLLLQAHMFRRVAQAKELLGK